MNKSYIFSPVPSGSGATVLHQLLADHIPNYNVRVYNPYWTICPFLLPLVCSDRNAAVVHAPADYGWFSTSRQQRLALTFHSYALDHWIQSYSTGLQKIHCRTDLRWWSQMSVRRADCITAVSSYIADLVRQELQPAQEIAVIYNGIDTERFRPGFVPAKKGGKTIRVFFSGNLTLRKGAQWLPVIADRLDKNITICYTAGMRTRDRLPRRPNLVPVGPIGYADMPARYRDMDILLMPTVREGFGLAVVEAMASGLPVVASDCSAIPELLDEGKGGYLCPVGDVDTFAAKINLLAASPGLRKEMGQYNRVKAEERFSLQRMVRAYSRLFDSLLTE